MTDAVRHAIHWFEIPVRDLARAEAFYGCVLDQPLHREQVGDAVMALFPKSPEGVGGCLFDMGPEALGPGGTVVYLDASPSLDDALARVRAAGGEITVPRTALPDGLGFFALFRDSEGNRVGLHAMA